MIIYDDIISFDYYILAHIITVIIIKKNRTHECDKRQKVSKFLRSQSGRFILVVSGFRPK